MIPLRQILDKARSAYKLNEVRYIHPSLYLICQDEAFQGLESDDRRSLFFRRIDLNSEEVDSSFSAGGVILHLLTAAERKGEFSFLEIAPASHHWMEFLTGSDGLVNLNKVLTTPIIHFYGFKGGQARSTVLAMLSKHFADDGYRVLAVDADIEAPSLHAVFETRVIKPESTLLGCVQFDLRSVPQPVYLPKASASRGQVDLIACKPSGPEYDLDLASFALKSALNPGLVQSGFEKILKSSASYDAILVDHRSGLASSVLPVIAAFPGPVVVCLRLDEQSDEADAYFEVLFHQNSEAPGLFVSFSLDPDDSREKLIGRNRPRVDLLLSSLGEAIVRGAAKTDADGRTDESLEIDPEDLLGYWVPWFHDRSFLAKGLPLVENILADNKNSLSKIRELLGLQASKKSVPVVATHPTRPIGETRQLTNSGNTDQGLLIQTEALRKLVAPNTPYTYVLGRKGTGKTRLVRALVDKKLGRPLLVADDFPQQDGVISSNPRFKDLTDLLPSGDSEKLWWVLLDTVASTSDQTARQASLDTWLRKIREGGPSTVSVSEITQNIAKNSQSQVFLIDGVETAFSSVKMSEFVEGLFRFLSAIQSNSHLNQKLTVRLFIRTDLARIAVENVEQQIEGRSLDLLWDTQSILNFALTRICDLPWFKVQFAKTTGAIEGELDRLADGAVSEIECNAYLLEIFPIKVRRNNLLTLTFLKDYFSEGLGESASFYPRIYDTFLRSIADPSIMGPTGARTQQIEDGRVAQPLIVAAHDYASKEYLKQVAAELKNLLRLSDQPQDNQHYVDSLIEAFQGLPTPFKFDDCVTEVSGKMNDSFTIEKERIRDALQQMKRVGIFENRPGYAGWWRAGRLFKNSLGMKYVR